MHRAEDYGWLGRAGIVLLSAGCLVTAALVPLVIRVIAAGLSPVVPAAVTAGARKSPWVVQPVFAGFSILSPSWLWIAMPSLLVVVIAFTRLVSGPRMTRVRRVPAWRSATVGVQGTDSYTASGFANPTRRVLAAVLHTRVEVRPIEVVPVEVVPVEVRPVEVRPVEVRPVEVRPVGVGPVEVRPVEVRPIEVGPVEIGPVEGRPVEVRPVEVEAHQGGPHLGYTSDVIEVVETYLYRPAVRPVMAVVRTVKRLQSGRLDAYLAYMLVALVALIALVVALA
jgi:hydrogenase-4 component B